MFDRNDLKAAQDAGVLDGETIARFEAFMVQRSGSDAAMGDGESLKFLANLNDVFLSIGIVLLIIGIATFSGTFFLPSNPSALGAAMALVPPAAAAWALAEYFCARRRLLLPSIVLCLAFCGSVGVAASLLFGENAVRDIETVTGPLRALGNLGVVGGLSTAGAALAFFARFRLPFALFVLALALAAAAYAGMAFFGDTRMVIGGTLALLIGLGTLAIAIVLDMGDPKRTSRQADFAFWLHLAAAPQIILGLRGMTFGFFGADTGTASAIIALCALLGFAVISLALNRRALIVSSLLTYGLAISAIASDLGLGALNTTIVTLLILGGAVVLIGGGWSTARRVVLSVLPRGGLFDRLFPPEPKALATG
ncbi:MAG: hypothetical protein AAF216_11935 [Pseudomonadota bacterium]